MQLLEPGFSIGGGGAVAVAVAGNLVIGRLPVEADPAITAALDRAWAGGVGLPRIGCPRLDEATLQAGLLLVVEAWQSDLVLVAEDPRDQRWRAKSVGARGSFDDDTVAAAWRVQRAWKETLERRLLRWTSSLRPR